MYEIPEVDGSDIDIAETIRRFNKMAPDLFPPLTEPHLSDGFWWLISLDGEFVGFAGMVLMGDKPPFENIGMLKRCYVAPDHRGHDLQLRVMMAREARARQLRLTHLVSDTHVSNFRSANNHRSHGFETFEPDQPWAKDSIFWVKTL